MIKDWKMYLTGFVGLAALIGAVTSFSDQLPRPVWSTEFQPIAELASSNAESILLDQISRLNLDLRMNQQEQESYRSKGLNVPRSLIESQTLIEDLLNRKRHQLKKYQGN